jgi:hypothetical protein
MTVPFSTISQPTTVTHSLRILLQIRTEITQYFRGLKLLLLYWVDLHSNGKFTNSEMVVINRNSKFVKQ